MAACGGLKCIFENSLPESPISVDSLSPWTQIEESMKTVHLSSFADLFGELHLKEDHVHHHDSQESSANSSAFTPSSPSSSFSSNSMFSADLNPPLLTIDIPKSVENGVSSVHSEKNMSASTSCYCPCGQKGQHKHSDSFSSMSSESLSMCTEGLGFESCDDIEDDWQAREDYRTTSFTRKAQSENENQWAPSKRSSSLGSFPPPISCISRSGRPWVCFKSYREEGRFILKEIRIPNQEVLHSYRENGRFRLQLVMSDDEILEEDEEDGDEKDEDIGEDNGDGQEFNTNGGGGGEEGKG